MHVNNEIILPYDCIAPNNMIYVYGNSTIAVDFEQESPAVAREDALQPILFLLQY